MAIEPINGFYVHDEVTDTDGVAKYDYDGLSGVPYTITVDYDLFEFGNITINSSGWTYSASTSRCRTKQGSTIALNAGDQIYFDDGTSLQMYIGWKTSSDTYGFQGWVTTQKFTAPVAGDYVILISARPETAIASLDAMYELLSHLKIVSDNTAQRAVGNISNFLNNTEFNSYKDNLDGIVDYNLFEYGNIDMSTTGWTYTNSFYRLRTKQGTILPLKMGDEVYLTDYTNCQMMIGMLVSGVYTATNWIVSGVFTAPADGDYVIVLANRPEAVGKFIFEPSSLLKLLRIRTNETAVNAFENVENSINMYGSFELKTDGWKFNANVKGINHKGYNGIAPEDTLPAFKLSKEMGFDYVECDVVMTSDRVPVILHDDTINRTARNADGTAISDTINIGSITYEQALQYDFGIWKSPAYAGTKIPTLEQFIALCRNIGLHPYIELKESANFTSTEIAEMLNIVKSYGMREKVSWISGSFSIISAIKNIDNTVRIGIVASVPTSGTITDILTLKTEYNEVFVTAYDQRINADFLDSAIENNVPVEIWTVNTTDGIVGLDHYISGVTSDTLNASKVLYEENI